MPDPRTLILRFADVEGPTIAFHQEVLAQYDRVWWGWWRKAHEPQRVDVLRAVARQLPQTIGLVNRRTERLYSARCVDMVVADDGEVVPSPTPELTPEYYRDAPFPAWFCLEEIKAVDLDRWNELFAGIGIPVGDPTLFWVEPDVREVEPSERIPLLETDAPGEAILHLSDLHYGSDHGYPPTVPAGRVIQERMRDAIVARVRQLGQQVGVIVISGDLTTQGDQHVLETVARSEIEALAGDLGVGLEHVLVVPGNHDVNLSDADAEATRSYRLETGFRTFLGTLFDDGRDLEAIHAFTTPHGRVLNFATLNSARMESPETKEYGYVGPRCEPTMNRLIDLNDGAATVDLTARRVLNFAVLHHHLLPVPLRVEPLDGKPVSVTLDAGKLLTEFERGSVHVALHGHQHVPFLGSVARVSPQTREGWDGYKRPLTVIGAGSAGLAVHRLLGEMRNNAFNLYTPGDGCLDVRIEAFSFGGEPKPHLQTRIEL